MTLPKWEPKNPGPPPKFTGPPPPPIINDRSLKDLKIFKADICKSVRTAKLIVKFYVALTAPKKKNTAQICVPD